ncbi:MAG: DNA-binding response regulator [Romboutsia sp.]
MQSTSAVTNIAVNDEINIDESRKHLTNLHSGSEGYITIAKKDPDYSQWHYKKDELLEHTEDIINDINAYVSQNTFYRPQRRIENIKELRAVYIDIDCYNSKYTKEAVQYFLENDLYGSKIPRPNYLIDSGRGLYYIILIKPVPSMAMPLWYAVQRYLFNALKQFGADANALDPTRVLRIVGTLNSKSGTCVEVLDAYDYEYSLKEIQQEYLPEISEKKKGKGRPKKMVSLFTEYSLYYSRVKDITKICELRDYDMEGHREITLFLYRYFSACFTQDVDEALSRALELNSMFRKPLPGVEVIRDTKSATRAYENKLYKYTNAKLIEILDIDATEQRSLETIIGTKEKYRRKNEKRTPRNEKGLTNKQQELENLKLKIIKLKSEDVKNKDISKELDIPLKTLERHITKMRKNKEI